MPFDCSHLNRACLNTFGQALSFTPAVTGEPQTVTGILLSGVELEESFSGEGSINAGAFLAAADVSPVPEKGDEIATTTTVYKIVRIEQDAAGGLRLGLRQDRMI